MGRGRIRLYRYVVAYELASDGRLIPLGPPQSRVPAAGEARLYRAIAGCAKADDAAIVALASRYGPLGPTASGGTLEDERLLGYRLGISCSDLIADLGELDRWLASGGMSVAVPARLAPAAQLLVAVAQMDPQILESLLHGTQGAALPAEERARTRQGLWSEGLSALARHDALLSAADHPFCGDEPAHVAVPAGVTQHRLRLARQLLITTFGAMGGEGGLGAVYEPGGLARWATLLNLYSSVQETPVLTPESADAWRTAASELAMWQTVVRLLNAPKVGQQAGPQLREALLGLQRYAAIDQQDCTRRGVAAADAADRLRIEAEALLTLRLQQVGAWPFPEGEAVGTFARALWSLWPRITGHQPSRRCRWREGCQRLLPDHGHGNRRYCEEHRREAARQRAQRNRDRKLAER